MRLSDKNVPIALWRSLSPDWKVAVLAILGLMLYFAVAGLPDLGAKPEKRRIAAITPEPSPEILFPAPPTADDLLAWKSGKFGRTLFFKQLRDIGISGGTVQTIVDTLTPVYDFRKSHPNHQWKAGFEDGVVQRFVLEVSPVEIYDIFEINEDPFLQRREVEVFSRLNVIRGNIDGSLFGALRHVNGSAQLVALMEQVFAWDVDFYTDPRKGDTFDILVEEKYIMKDGEAVFNGYGNILASRYFGQNHMADAWRFDNDDETGYYSGEGQSLVRDFLRSPLKLQPVVTSAFQRNRFHPILKKNRPHNGVDYGARKGTPVMAVADGKVVKSGRYGGAGLMVELQHRNQTITHYLHFSKIAKGIKRGVRVKQGQVVGYVG